MNTVWDIKAFLLFSEKFSMIQVTQALKRTFGFVYKTSLVKVDVDSKKMFLDSYRSKEI